MIFNDILVGGFKHFFHILGIIIPTDFHIFQRGWNHQPVFNDSDDIYFCCSSYFMGNNLNSTTISDVLFKKKHVELHETTGLMASAWCCHHNVVVAAGGWRFNQYVIIIWTVYIYILYIYKYTVYIYTGWWFGTWLLFFHNIWDNPSHYPLIYRI